MLFLADQPIRLQYSHQIKLLLYSRSPEGEGGILFYLCPSIRPRYFSSHFSQELSMAEIWYLVTSFIWVCHIVGAFLDPSDSYFLFADLVGFYTHWTYMHIFRHIFLSNYWWHKSDIWSQASYWYPISWEAFLDPSDSYFLFANFVDFYIHWTFSSHFSKQILMAEIWYFVTSFI